MDNTNQGKTDSEPQVTLDRMGDTSQDVAGSAIQIKNQKSTRLDNMSEDWQHKLRKGKMGKY